MILGFLADRPMHGYELRQKMEKLYGYSRKISDGTLYPAIRRLVEAGQIEEALDTGEGSSTRRILEITGSGRARLVELVRDPGRFDIQNQSRFMVVLAFLSKVSDPRERALVLRRRLEFLEESSSFFYDGARSVRSEDTSDPYRRGMLRTARASSSAEVAWLKEQVAVEEELEASLHTPTTMTAVVLDAPGPPENLTLVEREVPTPPDGWVRIEVKAAGINRFELYTRLGLAEGVTMPRVLGIEATGLVDLDTTGTFARGQQVMTMMGGMGRTFDGGYAQFTCVPVGQVIPFASELEWKILGAIPEVLQTAYGALTVGLDVRAGQTLLIRGGSSSVGIAAAVLAKKKGLTVLSTTRNPGKRDVLLEAGADHVIIDSGSIAGEVRHIAPDGVDAAIELVGTPTLPDTLRASAIHGVVCFAGMLCNEWTVENFYPIDYLPVGVRLSAYAGESTNLPQAVLQEFLDDLASGTLHLPVDLSFPLEDVAQAHARMESGEARGKMVLLPSRD